MRKFDFKKIDAFATCKSDGNPAGYQKSFITFVKVNCPLHELERREIERGDRNIGQAKFQLSIMDYYAIYDQREVFYASKPENFMRQSALFALCVHNCCCERGMSEQ